MYKRKREPKQIIQNQSLLLTLHHQNHQNHLTAVYVISLSFEIFPSSVLNSFAAAYQLVIYLI